MIFKPRRDVRRRRRLWRSGARAIDLLRRVAAADAGSSGFLRVESGRVAATGVGGATDAVGPIGQRRDGVKISDRAAPGAASFEVASTFVGAGGRWKMVLPGYGVGSPGA